MKNTDVLETVLRTILNFQLLQYLDQSYEDGDNDAQNVVDAFLTQKFPDSPLIKNDLLPFLMLKTAIPMLAVPLCYAAKQEAGVWTKLGWTILPKYCVSVASPLDETSQSIGQVLRTMRNAVAHIPDFLRDECSPNVSWDDHCVVQFSARRPPCSVTFRSQEGFVAFLSDFIKHTRALIREQFANRT